MYSLTDTIDVYERHDWHARPWRTHTVQALPTEVFIHHGAEHDAEGIDTLAEQIHAMQATQAFHMDDPDRRWSDIAYHYVVFQPRGRIRHARIFEGRPVHHVPAAQGGHNTGTLAIVVFGNFDHDDKVDPNTRHAIDVLLTKKPEMTGAGAARTLGGHRDAPGQSTECPGDTLWGQLDVIARGAHLKRYRR